MHSQPCVNSPADKEVHLNLKLVLLFSGLHLGVLFTLWVCDWVLLSTISLFGNRIYPVWKMWYWEIKTIREALTIPLQVGLSVFYGGALMNVPNDWIIPFAGILNSLIYGTVAAWLYTWLYPRLKNRMCRLKNGGLGQKRP